MFIKLIKNPILLILLVAVVFSACSIGGDLPAPIITSGKLTGSVILYNERFDTLPKDGMTVTAEGTSFTAVTDITGKFIFANLPFNTYTFTYAKTGYGIFKIFGFRHTADSAVSTIPGQSLGQLSSTTVTTLSVAITNDTITINNTVSPASTYTMPRSVRYFFGNDASVSSSNYVDFSQVYKSNRTPSSVEFLKADFYSMGFAAGSTVFVKAYGDAYLSNMYHIPSSGVRIFPNLNTTTVDAVSFILP